MQGKKRDLQEPLTHTLCFQGVPDVAVEVIIPSKQEAPTAGEGDGCDSTDDALVRVHYELLVRPEVKKTAGGIVRAGADGFTVREELRRAHSKF